MRSRLTDIRQSKGLTLQEVARDLCVSVNMIWKWERKKDVMLSTARRLAAYYQVEIDQIWPKVSKTKEKR